MDFQFLSPELHKTAGELLKHYKTQNFSVAIEESIADVYNFRPTLYLTKSNFDSIVIELREDIKVEQYFLDFVRDCERNREPINIFIAIPAEIEDDEPRFSLKTDNLLSDHGIGVLVVGDNGIEEIRRARLQSLRYIIPAGSSLKKYQARFQAAVSKFNEGLPVDGIRDVTELVEECARDLAKKAVRKSAITISIKKAESESFAEIIKCLMSTSYKGKNQKQILRTEIGNDLQSFRGARNLSHHPRNLAKRRELQAQYIERMDMGVRLIREMLKAGSKI